MKPLSIVSRAFNSKVKDMAVGPEEQAELEAAGVSDPTIQRYLLWRKASIVMVIIATVLSAAVTTYSTYMEDEDQPDVLESLSEMVLKKIEAAVPAAKALGLSSDTIDAAKAAAAPAVDAAKDAVAGNDEKKEKEDGKDEEEAKKGAGGKGQPFGGKVVDSVALIALYAMPIAAVIVLFLKNRFRLAYRVLVGTFLFSFFLPMLVDMLPWSLWEHQEPPSTPIEMIKDQAEGLMEGAGVLAALLPTVLSLIPGVQKACLRVKAILPQSSLTGWFVVVASPLYGLFLLVIFVAVDQVTDQPAILASLGLLALASLFYAFRPGVVTKPLVTEQDFKRMKGLQLTVALISALAGGILVVYLLSTDFMGIHLVGFDPKKSLMSPIDLLAKGLEIISRSMFVSVVGAELMMRLNLMAWKQDRTAAVSPEAAPYDGAMEQMQSIV